MKKKTLSIEYIYSRSKSKGKSLTGGSVFEYIYIDNLYKGRREKTKKRQSCYI